MTETLILTRAAAEEFAIPFLLDAGLPEADAAIAARCLVRADLRGVDTHGMVRLPGYLDVSWYPEYSCRLILLFCVSFRDSRPWPWKVS